MITPIRCFYTTLLVSVVLVLFPGRIFCASLPTNDLSINSVVVDGQTLPLHPNRSLSLGSSPQSVVFNFGNGSNGSGAYMRQQCRLEGYENEWHRGAGFMFAAVRFFDKQGSQIDQKTFQVTGESPGWNGSLKTSPLTHRRETLTVPPGATSVWVVISSAGPPATVGIYVVANLQMMESSNNSPPVALMQSPFDRLQNADLTKAPSGWTRDGINTSMAKILRIGQEPPIRAFAIQDDDFTSHAEWRTIRQFAPAVTPGDRLVVEWNEMYSIGIGDMKWMAYSRIPPGNYQFHVIGLNPMGEPNGQESSLNVFVPQPLWRRTSFWSAILVTLTIAILGSGRYVIWQRMRREMLQLKNQQVLERERLRIAHDIHDDLGARVTQISIASAMSLLNTALPEKTRVELDQIKQMSRDLVSALYQTVWVVNPEYDNLDALGNYLCQMVNQLCKQTLFQCRLDLSELPHDLQISSSVRHNISMTVKEAVHNVIKHAGGSEIVLTVTFRNKLLAIQIQDNGCGFKPINDSAGHGLTNMKQRMNDIGGNCVIESSLGQGTTVKLNLVIK
jgi:signal transduction histidine kinase